MSGQWRGKRVLVTGGTGFIGSCLVRRLAAAAADVHLLVRPTSDPRRIAGVWDKVERHVGDLSDASSLASCVRAASPEFVFHLAKERESSSFEKEAAATTRLAAALKRESPRLKRWIRTAHAVREENGRGADAELCRALASRFGLPIVTLELFQVYGPGQNAGDPPLGLLREALDGGRAKLSSGGLKDFVYIEDVARAYELAALVPGIAGTVFQIGSGRAIAEGDAVRAALKLLGRKVGSASGPEPAHGHPADLTAASGLGWKPRTSLEDGLALLLKWWDEGQGSRAR